MYIDMVRKLRFKNQHNVNFLPQRHEDKKQVFSISYLDFFYKSIFYERKPLLNQFT